MLHFPVVSQTCVVEFVQFLLFAGEKYPKIAALQHFADIYEVFQLFIGEPRNLLIEGVEKNSEIVFEMFQLREDDLGRAEN